MLSNILVEPALHDLVFRNQFYLCFRRRQNEDRLVDYPVSMLVLVWHFVPLPLLYDVSLQVVFEFHRLMYLVQHYHVDIQPVQCLDRNLWK